MNKLLITLIASAFALTAFAQAPKPGAEKGAAPATPPAAQTKQDEKKPAKGAKKGKAKAKGHDKMAQEKKAATK